MEERLEKKDLEEREKNQKNRLDKGVKMETERDDRRKCVVHCRLKEKSKPGITEIKMKVIEREKVGNRVRATCQSPLVT